MPSVRLVRSGTSGRVAWSAMRRAVLVLVADILLVGSPAPRAEGATTVIAVGDFWFCDSGFAFGVVCPTTVTVGDTVEWDFSSSIFPHTSTDCGTGCGLGEGPFGGVWDSGTIFGGGGPFQFTFTETGTFLYYCTIHPTTMLGEITVTSAVGGIAELPRVDRAPQQTAESQGGPNFVMFTAAASAAAAALVLIGVLARRRRLR